MFVLPVDQNLVHISTFQTGCFKSEFDSTYPVRLNGIIGPDEFQQSINNINKVISSRTSIIVCGLIFILCIGGGIALFIVGGSQGTNSRTGGFPMLVGIGFGIFGLGIFFVLFACFIVQTQRRTRMYQAVARESMRYSTRTPIPCSWRLNASRVWSGGYRNRGSTIVYRLVIEIGNSGASGNVNAPYQFNQLNPQTVSYFPQQNNMYPPPPSYYNQSTAGFCSQCGAPRSNSTTKFCSSCGQQFNY